ncbi:MAG TPA: MG2 domain-containing protein, partial [Planctomycetota bacterium]|nr:MG2 domain-containing protein [Planctomycetota bacterium]
DLARNTQVFAGLSAGGRQAFATGHSDARRREDGTWRIYAFTDRPAYRPGEKVEWKLIARMHDGAAYSTPARRSLEFQIADPRGAKAAEGTLRLSELGSAWSSLELTEAMPLGEYRVTFWNEGRKAVLGGDMLFRLEEYKLPEFKVTIETPEEGGKKKAFRLGERVDVNITAEYYFGGPVADAAVEVLVYQNVFYHTYQEPRDFPWLYEDMQYQPWRHRGQGQIVKRETLRTDSAGKTIISIDTPRGQGQDLEYRIEARVTDSSRREIVGSDSVRVTRQRYYVTPRAEHSIYRPGDTIKVTFKALDSNQEPVEAEGAVKVTRERWVEIWLSPEGKEVRGEDLARLRAGAGAFPPPGKPGWRIKFRGYERDDILSRSVKTDREGNGELSFPAAGVGFYRIAWRSEDRGGPPVRAEASVWVTTRETTDLAYRHGGLQIVLDRDTFRTGDKAHVLLTSPVAGRHVLFTVEGEDLHHFELVHLTGPVKLIELDIEEKHVPNIFLGAVLLSDREVFQDTQQVVVPPVRHFLDVEVTADRSEYLPREEATLGVTTRDRDGKPVSAEVSIALVDESIFYIQKEYAGDPRQFFFGEKRPLTVRTRTSLEEKRFAVLPSAMDEGAVYDSEDRDLGLEFDGAGLRRQDMKKNMRFEEGRARGKMQMLASRSAGPAAPGAPAPMAAMADAAKEESGGGAGGPEDSVVVVRSDFRSTVLWQPDLRTGEDGKATVKVQLPDSLTRWRASSRVVATENRFGTGVSSFRTRQPLIVRLQAPRFFVVGDTAVVSAVINNNTDRPQAVTASLEAAGLVLKGAIRDGALVEGAAGPITVDAGGEARADWLVTATAAGTARLKVTGRGEGHADAMEKTYLVHEHGIEKLLSKSGKLRGDAATIKLDLPPRKDGSTRLTVQVAPSLAVTMLDALPYLADYPYGCTEQTLSRFLPAVITAKTLRDLGLEPGEAMERVFGGIEAASAEKTHPGKKKDLRKIDEMAQQGLERLQDFQHADGGWGWWKEGDSDHFMTAYVVWGLTMARAADLDVKPEVIERGAKFLEVEIVEEEEHPDMQAWMLHALASVRGSTKEGGDELIGKAFENLWTRREQLNAYTRALFALAAHQLGLAEKAKTLVRNLEDGVKVDLAPDRSVLLQSSGSQPEVLGTAHWGEDGIYWRWSEGGVEATAFGLRALLAIDPQNRLVEQVTNWLVKNRRGAQWSNTRDTAIVVLALNDYLKKSGELEPNAEYEVTLNGATVVSKRVTPADALNAPSRFTIDAKLLRETTNEVRIVRKNGKSPLYFSVEAVFFSLEEPVLAAGNEIFVKREYQKLAARPTLLAGIVHERAPLGDGGTVKSGERVEVTLTIDAKNHYEYLVFEDLKPAGLEAVEIRSGAPLYARELKESAVERGATRS